MKILYATRAVFGPCEIHHRDPSRGRKADAAEGRTTSTRLCWHNDYRIKCDSSLLWGGRGRSPSGPSLLSEIREERAAIRQAESYRKARRRILRELRARKDADAIARANAFFRRTDELPAIIREMSATYNTQSRALVGGYAVASQPSLRSIASSAHV